MSLKKHIRCCCLVLLAILIVNETSFAQKLAVPKTYYISAAGNDANSGTQSSAPFKTIEKVNSLHLMPGDQLLFKSGETFEGIIKIDPGVAGSKNRPITIRSYGKGRAVIDAGNSAALSLYKTQYVTISNLHLKGSGRKEGNQKSGLNVLNSSHIMIDNVETEGFQKSGLVVYVSSQVNVKNVYAHNNGYAGISLEGTYGKRDTRDVTLINCHAENNPGDPTNFDNHSGNGIVAGNCKDVLIDHCTANNNGWDMPRIGNGPVGIWAYECDRIIIQHCLAYQNKTSKGGEDGGGFDFDGGITNSIIQYCVSYENQGSGYCLFQYAGASPWYNNIIRYNISENDGTVSASKAGIYVWNSSEDASQFYDCSFYGNIIYNSKAAVLSFSNPNHNKDFRYYQNIFVGKDELIIGKDKLGLSEYKGNVWWSLKNRFNIDGIKQLKTWAKQTGNEMKDGKVTGLNVLPEFKDPGHTRLTSASQLPGYTNYQLPKKSGLKKKLRLLQLD